MRVSIATRIFHPEPSAASFRLQALADELARRGHRVHVRTVTAPRSLRDTHDSAPYRVSRVPVLRDRTGYVRGYLQYLSFDVPLIFRVLFGARSDAIIVEPPPTTWFAALIASTVRRIPFYSYAADIWSDASESTGAPAAVVRAVRWMERRVWRSSRRVFAVNEGVADRVREIAPGASVVVVGNGINTETFTATGPAVSRGRYVIYTGTASEWQGAEVFVEAIAELHRSGVDLTLVFLGQGTALTGLRELAQRRQAPVEFLDPVPPAEAAKWLRGAAAGLASIRPGAGYDFAFPTKLYAAWATGTPALYAGPGPVRATLEQYPLLGIGVDHDPRAVAAALHSLFANEPDGAAIEAWARDNVSLRSVAERVIEAVEGSL